MAITLSLKNDTGASSTDKNTFDANLAVVSSSTSTPILIYDSNNTNVGSFVWNGSAWVYDAALEAYIDSLQDGIFTLVAKQGTSSSTLKFTLDAKIDLTARLTTDSGVSATDGITNKAAITGTGDVGATLTIYEQIDADTFVILGTTKVGAAGTWAFTPSGLANGSHTLVVEEKTLSGLQSSNLQNDVNLGSSAVVSFIYDTIGPKLTQALVSDSGSSATDKITNNPTLTGLKETGTTVSFVVTSINGALLANPIPLGQLDSIYTSANSWIFQPAGLNDGKYVIQATQTDQAGNTSSSSFSFTLDTQAPTVMITQTVPTTVANIYNIGGTAAVGTKVTIINQATDGSSTNTVLGTVTVATGGTWTFKMPALPVGHVYSIIATQADSAGNLTTTAPLALDLTSNSSTAKILSVALQNDTGASNADKITQNPALSGLTDPNFSIRLTFTDSLNTLILTKDVAANASGLWSYTPTFIDGTYKVVAKEILTNGTLSSNSATLTFTQDTSAPQVAISGLMNDTGVIDNISSSAKLIGSSNTNGVVQFMIDGVMVSQTASASNGSWTFTPPSLTDGQHTVVAVQKDLAGNLSSYSAPFTFTLSTKAPAITIAGSNGFVNGGGHCCRKHSY